MNLLPPNTTALERAFEAAIHRRIDAIPVPIRDVLNPATCPVHLLDFLAWTHSLDVWDDGWAEDHKRAAIDAAFRVHRHKGTIGSVRRALAALKIGLEIREWFETGSAPGTFAIDAFADNIFAAGFGINPALLAMIAAHIDTIKPARAHYSLRVGENFTTRQPVRTAARAKRVQAGAIDPEPRTFAHPSPAFLRTMSAVRRVHRHHHDVKMRPA